MAGVTRDERRGRSRHLVAGLGAAQVISWGTLYYAFPLIAVAMEPDLGLSKPELYGAATFGLSVGGLVAYPVGAAIDRGYGRVILTGGSVLAALLLFAWSRVAGLPFFYAVFAGVGVAQAMTLYEPAFAVVARRAIDDARNAITMLTLWGGFASTVFVPLTQALLDRLGWRGTLVALGGLNLCICFPIHSIVVGAASVPPPPTPERQSDSRRSQGVVRAALRNPVFAALGLSFTLYYGAFAALTYHLYPLLLERGFGETIVVTAIALIGPAQVAGRVLVWWLVRDRSIRGIGMATTAALPLSVLALIALPSSFVSLAVFAVVYGAANGVMTIVRGMAVPEMVTKEAYGRLNGILAAPGAVARAVAPVAAAALWALGASYDPVLKVALAMAGVSAATFWAAVALTEVPRRSSS